MTPRMLAELAEVFVSDACATIETKDWFNDGQLLVHIDPGHSVYVTPEESDRLHDIACLLASDAQKMGWQENRDPFGPLIASEHSRMMLARCLEKKQ